MHPQGNGQPERRQNNKPDYRGEKGERSGFGGNRDQQKERRDKPFREPRQSNRGDMNKDNNNRERKNNRAEQREK